MLPPSYGGRCATGQGGEGPWLLWCSSASDRLGAGCEKGEGYELSQAPHQSPHSADRLDQRVGGEEERG